MKRNPLTYVLMVMVFLFIVGITEPGCCQPGGYDEISERK